MSHRIMLLCALLCLAASCLPLSLATSSTLVLTTDSTFSLSVVPRTPADDNYNTPPSNIGVLFALSGVSAPRLVVSRGVRLTFTTPDAVHPFYATTVPGAGGAPPFLTAPLTSGSGSNVTWIVDPYGSGTVTLHYGCAVHAYMGNIVTVVYNASDPAQIDPNPPLVPPSSSASSFGALSSSTGGGSSQQCPVCPSQVFSADLLPGVKLQWFIEPLGQAEMLMDLRAARALQLQSIKVPRWMNGAGGGGGGGSNSAAMPPARDGSASGAQLETQASKRLGHLSSTSQLVPSHSPTSFALDPTLHPGSLYVITFTLTATDIQPNYFGFVGLGFNSQKMRNCDLIVCMLDANGNAVVLDAWANDHAPQTDVSGGHTDDIFNATSKRNADGSTSFKFSRLLDSGDSWDGVLPTPAQNDASPQPTAIIFSHGPASRQFPAKHGIENAGAGAVNFNTGASSLFANNDAAVRLLHGISMLLTWLVAYPLGGFTARYLKHWSHWLRAHEFLQTTGTVGAISFAVMQMVQNADRMRQWTLHGFLGIIITICLIVQVSLGQFSLWRLNTSRSSWWHRPLAKVHKFLGIALVTGGPYQVSLGIDLLWPDEPIRRSLYYVAIGILIGVFVTAESYKRVQASVHSARIAAILNGQESDLLTGKAAGTGSEKTPSSASLAFHAAHPAATMLPPAQFLSLPSLSWADVSTRLKAGAKLLVIRDIVLDVRPFFTSHPGGRSTLEDSLGTDATQAFFGKDPDALLTHTHSAFAWRKLSSMAVGVLRSDAEGSKDPKVRRESLLVASDGTDASREAVLASRRGRRLHDLLVDARVVSKPAAGDAAHFRRYRIVYRELMSPSIVCLRMEQIPDQHPRPFLWRDYELLERRAEVIAAAATEAAAIAGGPAGEAKVRFAESAASPSASASASLSPAQPPSDAASLDLGVDASAQDDPSPGAYGVGTHAAAAGGSEAEAPPFLTRAYVNLMNLVVGNQRQRASIVPASKRRGSRVMPASVAGSRAGSTMHLQNAGSMVQLTHIGGEGAEDAAEFNVAAGSPLQVNPVGSALRQRGAMGAAAAAAVARSRVQRQGSVLGPSKIHWFQAGEHVELQGVLNGDPVDRSYSPIPCYDAPDQLQIVFKVYPHGQLTQWLAKRVEGDYVKIRGECEGRAMGEQQEAATTLDSPPAHIARSAHCRYACFLSFLSDQVPSGSRSWIPGALRCPLVPSQPLY